MLENIRQEFRKITWLPQKMVNKKTGFVIVISILLGVIISMIDFISKFGVDKIVSLFM